ncbi:CotH kinase family protein [candidate division KSB1 bacterium]|nr:CotH kinase family protein [candidate division KSB1 bacterium]
MISSLSDNAIIKYTIDGSEPTGSKTAVSALSPVTISIDPANTSGRDKAPGYVVRACAVKDDSVLGLSVTHTYLFLNQIGALSPEGQRPGPLWPLKNTTTEARQMIDYGIDPDVLNDPVYKDLIYDALTDVPTISLVTDLENLFDTNYGIYVNATEGGRDWERPASLELIHPDGEEGFQINCGVRIRGAWHRNNFNPKHGFRFFFRGEYGETKLKYPLFEGEGTDEFDNIDLRTSQNYSWAATANKRNTMVREVFSRDTQRDMGQPYTRSRYYHLYINGTYWGLYQTQERSEASYAATYFGDKKEDYDVVKVDPALGMEVIATDGNLNAWRELWQAAKNGFIGNEQYYKILGQNPDGSRNPALKVLLDMDNLIDYMICTYYAGDLDAPISSFINNERPNNFYGIYNRNGNTGFQFFRHDGEHTLLSVNDNRTGPYPAGSDSRYFNPQWLHQQLIFHPAYRLRFADRVYKHFYHDGALTPEAALARILARKQQIDLAIIAESARWGDTKTHPPLTKDNAWLPEINFLLNEYLPYRTDIVAGQFIDKGWYPDVSPPVFSHDGGVVAPGFDLSITAPAGQIYYTVNGSDPLVTDPGQKPDNTIIISENTIKQVIVPTKFISSAWRRSITFDDSEWRSGKGGIGYEKEYGYGNLIHINVEAEMYNDGNNPDANTTCYIRIPFTIDAEKLNNYNNMVLNMHYDDGFVAFINGIKVAEANAPPTYTWTSLATENHEDTGSEAFNISNKIKYLTAGENLLTIQGLNISNTSSDFIILPELVLGETVISGVVSPYAFEYNGPVKINETTQINARVTAGNKWSVKKQANFAVTEDLANMKVTEIHYHPLDEGPTDGREYEFIEFRNCGSRELNLTLAAFTAGIAYTFPTGFKMQPGQIIILASNMIEFYDRYRFYPFREYNGQFDNGGERIVLIQASGDTVLSFRYNDKDPWPTLPDTLGYSLVAKYRQPVGDPNQPEYWKSSQTVHGSPGAYDPASDITEPAVNMPGRFRLYQNYPNPFNPVTTIRFDMPQPGFVELKIYNINGREIATLFAGQKTAGTHNIDWNASQYASGIYLVRLKTGHFKDFKKLLLLK